jgi:hypothetical protein
MMVAAPSTWSDGALLRLAHGNRAIYEIEIAIGFFPAQLRDNLVLSPSGRQARGSIDKSR